MVMNALRLSGIFYQNSWPITCKFIVTWLLWSLRLQLEGWFLLALSISNLVARSLVDEAEGAFGFVHKSSATRLNNKNKHGTKKNNIVCSSWAFANAFSNKDKIVRSSFTLMLGCLRLWHTYENKLCTNVINLKLYHSRSLQDSKKF